MLALLLGVLAWAVIGQDEDAGSRIGAASPTPQGGAANLDLVTRTGPFAPTLDEVYEDIPDYYTDGCQLTTEDDAPLPAGDCEYGPADGTPVAVLGDSKVGQWMPALQRIAEVENWRLLFYSRSSCPFATDAVDPECASFVEQVASRLGGEQQVPLAILSHVAPADAVAASEAALLTQLHEAAGTRTVAIADTPQPGIEIPECLAAADDYWLDCGFPRHDGSGTPVLRAVVEAVPEAKLLSMNDVICSTGERCAPVMDSVLLYRRGSHLTKTFVDAITPVLHQRLIDAGVANGPVIEPD